MSAKVRETMVGVQNTKFANSRILEVNVENCVFRFLVNHIFDLWIRPCCQYLRIFLYVVLCILCRCIAAFSSGQFSIEMQREASSIMQRKKLKLLFTTTMFGISGPRLRYSSFFCFRSPLIYSETDIFELGFEHFVLFLYSYWNYWKICLNCIVLHIRINIL